MEFTMSSLNNLSLKKLFLGYMALVVIYYGVVASDRYVSEANVVLESPQLASSSIDFSSFLGDVSGKTADMLLLRDYLLSTDMLLLLEERHQLRNHYANSGADWLSALWDDESPTEILHEYFLTRVSVELDDYAKVLRISAQAYTPEYAQAIVNTMLQEGERHMNELGRRLATEQVKFLEQQVRLLGDDLEQTRQSLLSYQNKQGLVSPTQDVTNLSAVVAELEAKLANLQAQKSALQTYQSDSAPEVIKVNSEIAAVKSQIASERARMTQESGQALNKLSAEYGTLELNVKFAQDSYSGALVALQNTRIEASRKLKQLSVLQTPMVSEYAVYPKRIHGILLHVLISAILLFILKLIRMVLSERIN